ncbi:MAG: hypothetical protein AAGA85_27850 [Bacteroidota bacterium]
MKHLMTVCWLGLWLIPAATSAQEFDGTRDLKVFEGDVVTITAEEAFVISTQTKATIDTLKIYYKALKKQEQLLQKREEQLIQDLEKAMADLEKAKIPADELQAMEAGFQKLVDDLESDIDNLEAQKQDLEAHIEDLKNLDKDLKKVKRNLWKASVANTAENWMNRIGGLLIGAAAVAVAVAAN